MQEIPNKFILDKISLDEISLAFTHAMDVQEKPERLNVLYINEHDGEILFNIIYCAHINLMYKWNVFTLRIKLYYDAPNNEIMFGRD